MNRLLIVLTVLGSALCTWPAAIEPSIDFPRWILLVPLALMTGLSATLSNRPWWQFAGASVAGVFAGTLSGAVFFPSHDPIAQSYAPFVIAVATLAAAVVSLPSGLVGRKLSVLSKHQGRAVWLAFLSSAAFGPVALALTPPLVENRVARHDRAAVMRFEALRSAVEQTVAETGDPERICDGKALRRHYSGPSFRDEDWQRIAGNYVQQDGYVFGVNCHDKGNTIDAWPKRGRADGTLHFCADATGKLGCGGKVDPWLSRPYEGQAVAR